jgi:para-nitrobenzyl esterase
MKLTRREVLSHSPKAVACAVAIDLRDFARPEEPKYVEVKTVYGRIRGLQGSDLVTFKGIPYAGLVSGANRFKAAPPLKPGLACAMP